MSSMMRCFTSAVVLSALCCPLAHTQAICSSLNGPFCTSAGGNTARSLSVAPPHAAANLDVDKATLGQHEIAKRIKIERILKQYEIEAALSTDATGFDHSDAILDTLDLLLDGTAALFSEYGDDDDDDLDSDEGPVIGSFAFNNEGGVFEQLDRMNGVDLKEFFELALDEVIESYATTLDAISPDAAQGLHTTVQQLRALTDVATFEFEVLDATRRAQIRYKFANHRLIEVQQTFEKIVVARSARERRVALEASVYLFQLAQEAAAATSPDATAQADAAPSASRATSS